MSPKRECVLQNCSNTCFSWTKNKTKIWKKKSSTYGRYYQTTFPPNFSSFFPKQEKQEKTGNVSKVWKLNWGQNVWNASHSNIWKKKWKIWKYKKLREKKTGNLDKTSFDKKGRSNWRFFVQFFLIIFV